MIGLTETWMNEEMWEKIRTKVSSNFVWNCVPARKEHKKGRAKGGIITTMRRNLREASVKELSDATVKWKLVYNGNKWRIITIYSQKVEETLETLMKGITGGERIISVNRR